MTALVDTGVSLYLTPQQSLVSTLFYSDGFLCHGHVQCNTPMQLRQFSIVQKQHKDSSLLGHSAMSIGKQSPLLQSTAVSSSLAKSSSPGYPDNESITSL